MSASSFLVFDQHTDLELEKLPCSILAIATLTLAAAGAFKLSNHFPKGDWPFSEMYSFTITSIKIRPNTNGNIYVTINQIQKGANAMD